MEIVGGFGPAGALETFARDFNKAYDLEDSSADL